MLGPNLTKSLFWLIKSTQIIKHLKIVPVAYFLFTKRKPNVFIWWVPGGQGVAWKEWKGCNHRPGMKSWILATTGRPLLLLSFGPQDSLFNPKRGLKSRLCEIIPRICPLVNHKKTIVLMVLTNPGQECLNKGFFGKVTVTVKDLSI